VLPPQIEPIYNVIYNQITWAFAIWKELKYLFSEKIRIDLINHCAPTYFSNMQRATLNEIQLVICRLTDPKESGRYENVSFYNLIELLKSIDDVGIANKIIDELNKENENAISPIRNRRNKLLVHLDYETIISTPILELTKLQIDKSLSAFNRSLNIISGHYLDTVVSCENIIVRNGIAGLLYFLRDGTRYRELMKKEEISLTDLTEGKFYGV
jgi:hypothetical protein